MSCSRKLKLDVNPSDFKEKIVSRKEDERYLDWEGHKSHIQPCPRKDHENILQLRDHENISLLILIC